MRPVWENRQIADIGRADVAALLDDIEAKQLRGRDGVLLGGPVTADRVLAQVRKMMNWYATRDPNYISPIVRGMARTKPRERARTRILSDDEIKLLWPLLPRLGTFGAAVSMLFLTAQRRGEIQQMRRSQVGADDTWTIPAEKYKGKRAQHVPLSEAARALFTEQKQTDESDLVFTLGGTHEFQNWGHEMAKLKVRMARRPRALARSRSESLSTLPPWSRGPFTTRAGVRPDTAERVLGHAIPGVAGVYDRHAYLEEKRQALEALAALLQRIASGETARIVHLRAAE